MPFKILKKNKEIKKFCLKRRVKKLENKINTEVEDIILAYPTEAARMDNIQKNFPSESLRINELKLGAARRLLLNFYKN